MVATNVKASEYDVLELLRKYSPDETSPPLPVPGTKEVDARECLSDLKSSLGEKLKFFKLIKNCNEFQNYKKELNSTKLEKETEEMISTLDRIIGKRGKDKI